MRYGTSSRRYWIWLLAGMAVSWQGAWAEPAGVAWLCPGAKLLAPVRDAENWRPRSLTVVGGSLMSCWWSDTSKVTALQTLLVCQDARDGSYRWHKVIPGHRNDHPYALGNGLLVEYGSLGSNDVGVLDSATGRWLWQREFQDTGLLNVQATPVGVVCAMRDHANTIHLLAADTGRTVWRHSESSVPPSPPWFVSATWDSQRALLWVCTSTGELVGIGQDGTRQVRIGIDDYEKPLGSVPALGDIPAPKLADPMIGRPLEGLQLMPNGDLLAFSRRRATYLRGPDWRTAWTEDLAWGRSLSADVCRVPSLAVGGVLAMSPDLNSLEGIDLASSRVVWRVDTLDGPRCDLMYATNSAVGLPTAGKGETSTLQWWRLTDGAPCGILTIPRIPVWSRPLAYSTNAVYVLTTEGASMKVTPPTGADVSTPLPIGNLG